ncbi:SDR family oxidoreductase [Rhodoligotrophos defluvii]|uniref:SDR family oxidoreductase n=1 Tax=Rhodoligotrophos defluvii TaxID=2561934 RepID=UPI0010C9950F|nr:SDR family oxidoreductase [Rhodoligotrophos defluvii]
MSVAEHTRTAIVTGATSGIGHATAVGLLEAGAHVMAVGRRVDRLDELAARFGDRLQICAADLSRDGEAARVLNALPEGWAADTLIHAAGHDAGGNVPFHASDLADLQDKLAVNLTVAAALIHALLPAWVARDRGDLVVVGSIAAREAAAGLVPYGLTKHGLHGLMAGLRVDYAATGLRFVEIIPGVVRSGFATRRWGGDETRADAFYERFTAWLTPEDVAGAILWALAQPDHVSSDEIVLRPTRR